MEREAKTNILFLDACRNNPLTRNLARSLGTRSAEIGRGLASMESGAGTLISFSTQPGNVALDGSGRNSPYSGPLVKAIGTPGEDVLSMLTGVRNTVMAATSEKQVPWDNNALRAKFYFNPAPGAPAAPKEEPAQPQTLLSPDALAWSLLQNSQSEAVLEEFLRRFPSSVYAGFTKARLNEIQRQKAIFAESNESSYASAVHRSNREQVISFLQGFHIAAMGEPEDLLKYYSAGNYKQVLQVRREVNRIWPVRSYDLFADSVTISDAGSGRLLVRYRVRTLTRNKSVSRDRIWRNEAILSFNQGTLKIEEEKVGWEDQ